MTSGFGGVRARVGLAGARCLGSCVSAGVRGGSPHPQQQPTAGLRLIITATPASSQGNLRSAVELFTTNYPNMVTPSIPKSAISAHLEAAGSITSATYIKKTTRRPPSHRRVFADDTDPQVFVCRLTSHLSRAAARTKRTKYSRSKQFAQRLSLLYLIASMPPLPDLPWFGSKT
jgi:hypothetical protein